ncbi:MAG: hypothetical protein ACRERD_06945, partial [Candidatus Binatia bacterium]
MNDELQYWRGVSAGSRAHFALPPTRWNGHELPWGAKTYVMAILNLTPDSFSGDGLAGDANAAL